MDKKILELKFQYLFAVLKIWLKHKPQIYWLTVKVYYHRYTRKVIHFIIWLIQKFIILRNRIKYQYHKLTTYNTDKIWQTCEQKCDCWPGTYKYGDGCKECEMWNKFSPKLKVQLDKECRAYFHHCVTGE